MGSAIFRVIILIFSAMTLTIAVYDISTPRHAGTLPYYAQRLNDGNARVVSLRPGADGLRVGDVIELNRLSAFERFTVIAHIAGIKIVLPVERNGRHTVVRITPQARKGKPLDQTALGLFMLLVAIAAGLLVGLRAPDQSQARILSVFLISSALGTALSWLGNVTTSAPMWVLVLCATNVVAYAPNNYCFVLLGCAFPQVRSVSRTALARSALPLTMLFTLLVLWYDSQLFTSRPLLGTVTVSGFTLPDFLSTLTGNIVIPLVAIAGCITGLMQVDIEHRAQMRWVATAMITASVAWITPTAVAMIAPNYIFAGAAWLALFQDVPLLLLPYTILRHRLVDVSVVVGRTAVFGFVSLTVVAIFVLSEWIVAKVVENAMPGGGKAPASQLLILGVALGIGLSARTIHAQTEKRMNQIFFSKRARSMGALRRFAMEAEVITDVPSLLKLAFETVIENTDARYVALYMRDQRDYQSVLTSDSTLPAVLGENDSLVVRLRRWAESFENGRSAGAFSEALFVPMSVRGSLIGLLVCGPKLERTHYLGDEIETLQHLSLRVATAYAFMLQEQRESGDGRRLQWQAVVSPL